MKEAFKKVENFFLIICFIWGLAFLIINPPFQASDEPAHMYRMYGFTNGTLLFKKKIINGIVYPGIDIPLSLAYVSSYKADLMYQPRKKTSFSETKYLLQMPLIKQHKVFSTFSIPVYTPISYFPGFLFLWLLKLLNVTPVLMLYILRFCNLLTYLAMIYFAIKITPVKKWLFFSAGIVPQSIYFASSISTDPLVTGYAFLSLAYVLYLAYDNNVKVITKKNLIVLGLLMSLVNICKFPYIVLLLLVLIIPKEKFKTINDRGIYFCRLFLLNLFIDLLIISIYLISMKGLYLINSTYNLSVFEVIKSVVIHPFYYFKILYTYFILKGCYYVQGAFAFFGWADIKVFPWIVYTYLFLFTLFGFVNDTTEPEFKISFKQKIIFAIIFVIMTLITVFSTTVTFAQQAGDLFTVTQYKIFQGRYWIPLLPVAFLIFNNNSLRFNFKWIKILTLVLFNFMLLVCLLIIFSRFYV